LLVLCQNNDLVTEKIAEITKSFFQEQGWSDCFLIEVKQKDKSLEVFADCDGGITLEKCHKISRAIEAYLDESKVLGESYVLDVSSPGVGTPLKMPRQYKKNIGRKIEVKTAEEKVEGELKEVSDEGIVVFFVEKRKEGKKNIKVDIEKSIRFEEIETAKIKVSFK
jgi:ribosome maturation factor RimP